MRTLVTLAMLAMGGTPLCAQPQNPTELMKAGKFTAKFPSQPRAETRTAGGLTIHVAFAEYDKGKGGYMVVYSDLPADKLKAPTPAQILESGVRGLKENFRAKITESTATEFSDKKYPARTISAEKEDMPDWSMRGTLVLVGNRLYQVYVYGPKDFVTGSSEAKDFLESFAIME